MSVNPVTGSSYMTATGAPDLTALVFYTQMQRINAVDGELRVRMDGISARNERARAVQALMEHLRTNREDGVGLNYRSPALAEAARRAGFPASVDTPAELSAQLGVSVPPETEFRSGYSEADREAAVDRWTQSLQGAFDDLTNTNELEMLGLQRLMNVRDQAIQLMSTVSRADSDTSKAIIANLGG